MGLLAPGFVIFFLCLPLASTEAADVRYEERLLQWALALHGREIEPNPEGKRIEEVLIASEEIVAPSDPWPGLFNIVHVKTKPWVIRRELLFAEGETYSQELIDETERNLRQLFILAVARIIPVKARRPGFVSLLVVTKDLWSIRLNTEFNFVGPLLQLLWLRPTEQNFLGRNKKISLDFQLKLDTVAFGLGYFDPRLFGSRVSFVERAAIIFNRESGQPEGSRGTLQVGRPLYSLDTEWGFLLATTWNVGTTRVYRGASVWSLPYPSADAPSAGVPFVYRHRELIGEATYTRSYGREDKTNITGGIGGYARAYRPPSSSGLDDAQTSWFQANYAPRTENATYLTATASAYKAEYRVLHDIDAFALSEDFQVGHRLAVTLRWANRAFLSPIDFLEGSFSGRYRWYFKDDLLSVSAGVSVRYSSGLGAPTISSPWLNRKLALELHNVSPPLWIGRVVTRALWDTRAADLNHRILLLGGGNGLRGVAAEQLVGTSEILVNLEYRTRPLELWTLHVGLVLFWDAGTAYYGTRPPSLVHTVGLGFRALFPQFNVENLRVDLGYAINGPPTAFVNRISGSYGQITDYRPALLDRPD